MPVKHLAYTAIPRRKRENAAARAAASVKASLANAVTDEQKAQQLAKLEKIKKWATGELPVVDPKAEKAAAKAEEKAVKAEAKAEKKAARKGKDHKVAVAETLTVKEN